MRVFGNQRRSEAATVSDLVPIIEPRLAALGLHPMIDYPMSGYRLYVSSQQLCLSKTAFVFLGDERRNCGHYRVMMWLSDSGLLSDMNELDTLERWVPAPRKGPVTHDTATRILQELVTMAELLGVPAHLQWS